MTGSQPNTSCTHIEHAPDATRNISRTSESDNLASVDGLLQELPPLVGKAVSDTIKNMDNISATVEGT